MLNYLQFRTACDSTFGVFLVVWFFARHVSYMVVCRSMYADIPPMMPYGCYNSKTGVRTSSDGGSAILTHFLQPFRDPGGEICFNRSIRLTFLGLLLALQVLTLIWFGMILRVAYTVISGQSAKDDRSDDEVEEEEYEEEIHLDWDAKMSSPPLPSTPALDQEVVDVENLQRRSNSPSASSASGAARARGRRAAARASAISIPDKKELLGRIGCDKPAT
jgi:acyl-CoA-dependent ceramide synthase